MWCDSAKFPNHVCRLCANVTAVPIPIFGNGTKDRIDLKIKKCCLPIDIIEEDLKPKNVCYSCISKLEMFLDMIELCLAADAKFEAILQNANSNQKAVETVLSQGDDEQVEDEAVKMATMTDDGIESLLAEQEEEQEHDEEEAVSHGDWIQKVSQQENSLSVQHDGSVVMIGKEVTEDRHQEEDILLMVELKYKDNSSEKTVQAGSLVSTSFNSNETSKKVNNPSQVKKDCCIRTPPILYTDGIGQVSDTVKTYSFVGGKPSVSSEGEEFTFSKRGSHQNISQLQVLALSSGTRPASALPPSLNYKTQPLQTASKPEFLENVVNSDGDMCTQTILSSEEHESPLLTDLQTTVPVINNMKIRTISTPSTSVTVSNAMCVSTSPNICTETNSSVSSSLSKTVLHGMPSDVNPSPVSADVPCIISNDGDSTSTMSPCNVSLKQCDKAEAEIIIPSAVSVSMANDHSVTQPVSSGVSVPLSTQLSNIVPITLSNNTSENIGGIGISDGVSSNVSAATVNSMNQKVQTDVPTEVTKTSLSCTDISVAMTDVSEITTLSTPSKVLDPPSTNLSMYASSAEASVSVPPTSKSGSQDGLMARILLLPKAEIQNSTGHLCNSRCSYTPVVTGSYCSTSVPLPSKDLSSVPSVNKFTSVSYSPTSSRQSISLSPSSVNSSPPFTVSTTTSLPIVTSCKISQDKPSLIAAATPNVLSTAKSHAFIITTTLPGEDVSSATEILFVEHDDASLTEAVSIASVTCEYKETDSEDHENFTQEKRFPCNMCERTFKRKTKLNEHMAVHRQERPFQCDQCDKKFFQRWDLTLHKRLHAGLYQCEFCSKAFPARGKLDRHRRTHTGEKPFACPTCGKAFSDMRNLQSHRGTHSDERPHTCSTCGRGFRVRSHLIDHYKVHSKDMPFTCDTCGKSFKWKTNLNIHLKVHTGERFPCNLCGNEYLRRADLTKHRRSHVVLTPQPDDSSVVTATVENRVQTHTHICTICRKSYGDRAVFLKHIKSHNEQRQFTCDLCGKTFHSHWYLTAHKKTHSDIKALTCRLCGKSFSKKICFSRHARTHMEQNL